MLLALIILGVSALVELLVVSVTGKLRVIGCCLAAILLIAGTVLLLRRPNLANILVSVASVYKLFNVARVAKGQMEPSYIRYMARRTSVRLSQMQIAVLIAWVFLASLYPNNHWYVVFLGATLCVVLSFVVSILLRRSKRVQDVEVKLSGKLPSVTIAIPARNETDDLEACLRGFVASDYPKLEIIALDDCSQTTRTPELIKQFAHDGVRFIPGDKPRTSWLAKNQAYAALAEAASGEIILFCGVDIRVEPQTVSRLVAEMRRTKSTMLSVMPRNVLDGGKISMPQVMRYTREFITGGASVRRPVTLSSCWLVSRKALKKYGGFAAVSHKIMPESFFARQVLEQGTYRFSTAVWGVQTVKKLDDQRDTAIRTLYPALHRRPEFVCVSALLQVAAMLIPIALIIYGLATAAWLIAILGLVNLSLLMESFYLMVRLMYGDAQNSQILRFAPALLLDVYLLNVSMYKYEFSVVEWKGRNICEPVMHIEPHLPVLS